MSIAERMYAFLSPNPDNMVLNFLLLKRGKRTAYKDILGKNQLNTAESRKLEETVNQIIREEKQYEVLLEDEGKKKDLAIRKIDKVGALSVLTGGATMIGLIGKLIGWY